jgi:hypothetical protein
MLHPEQGESLRLRLLELGGGYGLTHRWMYDRATLTNRLERTGFVVPDDCETPSSSFRGEDPCSVHVVAVKACCGSRELL